MGYLTANTGLYQRLSPRELLRYFGELIGMDRAAVRRRMEVLIDWLDIGPFADLRCGGLSSGQKVRVSSEHGEFTARLQFFDGAQPGVINVPYGLHSSVEDWGLEETANPLAAVGNVRDPVTGLPDWYSTRVRVEAV